MDLITGLPVSKGFDAILTIVDHGCSRAALFLPCHATITSPQIAQKYLRHLYPWFGLPEKIISDCDPQFTSHFGKALTQELGIQQNISTAFHPQTDGLMEHTNQWVEQYLCLILANQKDWSIWLPVATAVHNNLANVTTGKTPHQLLIGVSPPLSPEQQNDANNVLAHDQVQLLKQYRTLAVEALNQRAKVPEARWQSGKQVWLEGKNL